MVNPVGAGEMGKTLKPTGPEIDTYGRNSKNRQVRRKWKIGKNGKVGKMVKPAARMRKW